MKYQEKSAIGNAGEYYFCYWISRNFNWPCRLLDIDIGIDGQIEIMDLNNHTTGDFIAVQIKTTITNNPSVSVSIKNLEYWAQIKDPVILVSIAIKNSTPKIFWKHINKEVDKLISIASKNKSETITVNFSQDNELKITDKIKFSMLPNALLIEKTNKSINQSLEICNQQLLTLWSDSCGEYRVDDFDGLEFYEDFLDKFDSFCFDTDTLFGSINNNENIHQHLLSLNTLKQSFTYLIGYTEELISFLAKVNSEFKNEFKERWGNHQNHQILARLIDEKCSW